MRPVGGRKEQADSRRGWKSRGRQLSLQGHCSPGLSGRPCPRESQVGSTGKAIRPGAGAGGWGRQRGWVWGWETPERWSQG